MLRNSFRLFRKVLVLICAAMLLFFNLTLNWGDTAQAAAMTDGLLLQTLVDLTPSGGTLTLDRDYDGKRDGWGYSETVELNKPITITGPSATSRAQVDNIRFKVNAPDVTIKNLRFEKGDDPHGLCIYIYNKEADRFTLSNCVFDTYGNYNAFSDSGSANDGGHIYITNIRDVTIKNCKFKYGRAQYSGGSVYLESVTNCDINGCEFTGNVSKNFSTDGTSIGGAIYAKGVKALTFTNCTFTDNMSNKAGGGAYFKGCDNMVFTNCDFSQNDCTPVTNSAYQLIGFGGAIVFLKSSASMTECDFTGNTSYQGGGIFSSKSTLAIQSTDFIKNKVDTHVIINPNLIRNIITTLYGLYTLDLQGFIEIIATYIMTESTCPGLQIDDFIDGTGKMGGEGGGIYAIDSNISLLYDYFYQNNVEKSGGGIYASSGNVAKTVKIEGSTFSDNFAASHGGAIAAFTAGTIIDNCQIDSNTASVGGGLYSVAGCSVKDTDFTSNYASAGGAVLANVIDNTQDFEGCTFSGNTAQGGGAIYAHGSNVDADDNSLNLSDCGLNLTDCDFDLNYSTQYGGAVSLYFTLAYVDGNTFSQNVSDGTGGALHCQQGAKAVVTQSTFNKNNAAAGGAAYNDNSKLFIYKCELTDNYGSSGAGAVHDLSGKVEAINCLFTGNKTGDQILTGGSVFELDATEDANITNCTIVDNYTSGSDAQNTMCAVYAKNGAKADLYNNILLSNTKLEQTSGFDILAADTSAVNAKYNICDYPGDGNIQKTIAVFIDYANGDYHLQYDYPNILGAMDKGTDSVETQNKDLDLNKRLVDADGDGIASPDLGAYESTHVRVTFNSISHGTVSGTTVQWIAIGQTADMQAVTVTPDDGWQFDKWVTSDNKEVSQGDLFYDGAVLYAQYKKEQVAVTFVFDPTKLEIAEARQGTLTEIDASTSQYVMYVNKYDAPYYPTMTGVDGWEFDYWDTTPSSVSAPVTITAQAGATASYNFGDKGYYDDGSQKTSLWITVQVNPLASPPQVDIGSYDQFSFVGWSDTEDGAVITLPSSVSVPVNFYAVYEENDVNLTVNINGGRYSDGHSDPSGIYAYGTEISPGTFGVLPPLGNLVFIGVTDQNDNVVNMESYALMEDTVLTWHFGLLSDMYPAMPRMYKVKVEYLDENGKAEWVNKYFAVDTQVDMSENTVYPEQGYYFVGWRDADGNDMGTFAITADSTVYPVFNKIVYPFNLSIFGNGNISTVSSISSMESTVSSAKAVSGSYNSGDIVWLTGGDASAGAGNTFVGYRDENGDMVTVVLVNGERDITALFDPDRCLISLQTGANGVINGSQSIICDYGDTINLGAVDCVGDSGYVFSHWESGGSTVSASYTAQGDATLTAVFSQETAQLTVSSGANGTVLSGLSGTYAKGSTVTANSSYAVPDANYEFTGFVDSEGNIVSSVVMDSDKTITAQFEYQQYRMTVYTMQDNSITGVYSTQWYDTGTAVDMPSSAQAPDGYAFTGWYSEGMEEVQSVTMNEDIIIYAAFESAAAQTTATVSESPTVTESTSYNYTATPSPTPTTTVAPTIPITPETVSTLSPTSGNAATQDPEIKESPLPADAVAVQTATRGLKLPWYLWVLIIILVLLILFIAFRIYVAIKIR